MKKIILFLFVLIAMPVFAQTSLTGGMGINFSLNPNLRNYLNKHWSAPYEQVPVFNSNVEFYAEPAFMITENLQLGIDYGYSIYSYSSAYELPYEVSYEMHSPTLMIYRIKKGEGYLLRLGGGLGYRNLQVEEKIYFAQNYTKNGFGIELKADGNTSLGGNLYANIGAILKFDFISSSESENNSAEQPHAILESVENVDFNIYTIGLRLGITYIF